MAGRRKLPVDLIEAKGNSNPPSRAEREKRREAELHLAEGMHKCEPPEFITTNEERTERFVELAAMLTRIMPDNFGAPDADCLGRYVVAQSQFETFTERIDAAMASNDPDFKDMRRLQLMQSDAFNRATKTASELGLTVTARCKLVVPSSGAEDQDDDF